MVMEQRHYQEHQLWQMVETMLLLFKLKTNTIMMTAAKEGKTPDQVVEHYRTRQQKDFKDLGIEFDFFSSSSGSDIHREMSQRFFKQTFDKGFFEKQTVEQFYDAEKEMFLPDRYVVGDCGFCGTADQNGDQCSSRRTGGPCFCDHRYIHLNKWYILYV